MFTSARRMHVVRSRISLPDYIPHFLPSCRRIPLNFQVSLTEGPHPRQDLTDVARCDRRPDLTDLEPAGHGTSSIHRTSVATREHQSR
jgi:hypothetical protein